MSTKTKNTLSDSEYSTDIEIDNKNNIQKVSFEQFCNIYNIYSEMDTFLDNTDGNIIKDKLNSLQFSLESKEKKDKEYNLLIILKLYKDIRLIDKERKRYIKKTQKYKEHKNIYIDNPVMTNDINNLLESEIKDTKVMARCIQKVFTEHKMIQELIIYKLLHHIPNKKVKVSKNNHINVINKICLLLDSFNPLLEPYLEDHSWTINTKNTLNFIVPKNKLLLSNTITLEDIDNTLFKSYMSMITNYLINCFDNSIKYVIEEDSKYDFAWVFIIIKYGISN